MTEPSEVDLRAILAQVKGMSTTCLMIHLDTGKVSKEDEKRLNELGFSYGEKCWHSHRFGRC